MNKSEKIVADKSDHVILNNPVCDGNMETETSTFTIT